MSSLKALFSCPEGLMPQPRALSVRACVRYRIRHQKTDGIGKEKELLYLEDDSQYEYWNKARRALSEWVNMGVF